MKIYWVEVYLKIDTVITVITVDTSLSRVM